ncbi:FtsX-like permease family protein [Aegicerativicinus sediminis]
MIKNYFKIAWRNIQKSRGYSIINIGGLAVGMGVAILIGLWINTELSFNKFFENHDTLAQVMQHQTYNGIVGTQVSNPAVMGQTIKEKYGSYFKHVVQASWNNDHALKYGDKILFQSGNFFEPEITEMLSLQMVEGNHNGLKELHSILLSESAAKALFGEESALDKIIKVDNKLDVKVTGIYKDLPENSSFNSLKLILPWKLYLSDNPWIEKMENPWGSNFTQTYVQIQGNLSIDEISSRISNVKFDELQEFEKRYKPVAFLHPMSKWYLESNFENGVNTGGRIDNVWLFGIIGIFVLLLACINFMNLSTARSEKRSKEVGIRKAIGSKRKQIIAQFFTESILISFLGYVLAIGLVVLILPFFNTIAENEIQTLWSDPIFWISGLLFSLITGLFAGIYPALYLSSFKPVKVLKGKLNVGRFSALPRKVLVTSQFVISIVLIIGTIIVYQQIKHAQNRPIGYEKDGLITISTTPETHNSLETIRTTLMENGAIIDMAESTSPTTQVWNTNGGFDWEGKDPNLAVDFPNSAVTYGFGKTIGWKIKQGRDFSREFGTDSLAFILNESAVTFINLKDPIGKTIKWNGKNFKVIGVVEDMLIQSPYKPVRPSMFHLASEQENVFILKLNPNKSAQTSIALIKDVFQQHNPAIPVEAEFVDQEFAKKFGDERRVGRLASFFAILAIFISCLGLYGLASYVAEQRTKEIGIRKVLGASVLRLWKMLSKDFFILVLIACFLAIPIGYYLMDGWLDKFDYRTPMNWWVFVLAALGAILITLITVSHQAIRASIKNPVNSLRTE